MSNTGATYPGTAATEAVSPEDDRDWNSINYIKAHDGLYAGFSTDLSDGYSFRAKVTNFGFSLPTGATIDGIRVEIGRRRYFEGDTIKDYRVQLLDADGNLVGSNKADYSTNWPYPAIQIKAYGGATDTWSASPTKAMVESANFGVVLSSHFGPAIYSGLVDFIRVTIYYSTITEKQGSDSGSGSEALGSRDLGGAEAGSGADAKATNNPQASLSKAETGSGSDIVAQLEAILEAAEVGEGVEAGGLATAEKTGSDSGTGVEHYKRTKEGEVASLLAQLDAEEAGSGEEKVVGRAIVLIETGSGVDVVVSLTGEYNKISSDGGSGIEAILDRAIVLPETGAGAEAVSGRAIVLMDIGEGVEVPVLVVTLTAEDIGEGLEQVIAIAKAILASDSGEGTETSGLEVYLVDAETGEGVDLATLVGVEKFGAEAGSGLDALAALVAAVSSEDAGAGLGSVLSMSTNRTLVLALVFRPYRDTSLDFRSYRDIDLVFRKYRDTSLVFKGGGKS